MAKQKAKRRGKNRVEEESKVAEEIVFQRMSGEVSGKQQKYSRIGAQEYVPFEQDELSIRNIKDACQKHFGPQIEKDQCLKFETKKCFTSGLFSYENATL